MFIFYRIFYYQLKVFRICHPKICCFVISIISGTWKTTNSVEGFLWTPLICLKNNPPKETKLSQISSQGVSSTGKMNCHHKTGNEKSIPHPDTLPGTIMQLIYFFKGPFVFPKNHVLSPKSPTSPLPFSYKLSNLTSIIVTHFFPPVMSHSITS